MNFKWKREIFQSIEIINGLPDKLLVKQTTMAEIHLFISGCWACNFLFSCWLASFPVMNESTWDLTKEKVYHMKSIVKSFLGNTKVSMEQNNEFPIGVHCVSNAVRDVALSTGTFQRFYKVCGPKLWQDIRNFNAFLWIQEQLFGIYSLVGSIEQRWNEVKGHIRKAN